MTLEPARTGYDRARARGRGRLEGGGAAAGTPAARV